MAWFKPARNSAHPGDPPPRWAPISRAGRLVLVVTVITGIVIALMITATRTAGATHDTDVAAVSPGAAPPPRTVGQRVEVPEAGLAVTFPEDWVIKLVEEGPEPEFIILTQPERFGPEVKLQPVLVAEGPDMRERDTFTFCTLVRYAPIDVTADEFLAGVFSSDELVVERLDDRSSRVLVNPWIQSRILVDTPEAIYVDHYAIAADNAVAILMCYGVASIVTTGSPSPSPSSLCPKPERVSGPPARSSVDDRHVTRATTRRRAPGETARGRGTLLRVPRPSAIA